MIQFFISIYFFREFYKCAKLVGANPWQWSVIGGGVFLVISFSAPIVAAFLAGLFGANDKWSSGIYVFAMIVGLGISGGLVDRILKYALRIYHVGEKSNATEVDPYIGRCPNCREKIALQSEVCPKCKASFEEGSAWKVQSS